MAERLTLKATPALKQAEDGASSGARPPEISPDGASGPSWLTGALALALVVAIALLVWSRIQLGGQIDELQAEIVDLRSEIAVRDRVIEAQGERLTDVRQRVDALQAVLAEPLPVVD